MHRFKYTHTKVTAEVFDKLNPLILLLLPKLHMPILTRRHNKICSVEVSTNVTAVYVGSLGIIFS